MAITNSIEYTNRIAGGVRKDILDKLDETNQTIVDLKLRTHVGEKLDYFCGRIDYDSVQKLITGNEISYNYIQSNMQHDDKKVTLKAGRTYLISLNVTSSSSSVSVALYKDNGEVVIPVNSTAGTNDGNSQQIFKVDKDTNVILKARYDSDIWGACLVIKEIGREILINEVEEVAKAKHIEDTPVGSILGVLSLTAPAHYLICDGTEYNIGDYPKLAEYFKDTLGSINYYGGDGVNTFAVPDFRGEFIRGYDETNVRDPLGSQRGIGKHEDATEIPYSFSMENYIEVYKNSEGENIPRNYDMSKNNNGNNLNISCTEDSRYQGMYAYTSRPTNVNVLWCIKYEPTYFMNYSPMYGGFNETILFEGEANALGQYSLNDNINDYSKLLVYIKYNQNGENKYKQTHVVDINDIEFGMSAAFRYIAETSTVLDFGFKDIHTFTIDTLTVNNKMSIYKIIGIKANSNTVIKNEDITIEGE